jgi:hypothetical protein
MVRMVIAQHFPGIQKPFNFPANPQFWGGGVAGCALQVAGCQFLAQAFLIFLVGPPSHSRKMKINGINLHSTFPTQIQLFRVCDTVGV